MYRIEVRSARQSGGLQMETTLPPMRRYAPSKELHPLRGLHCFPRPPPKGKHPPCVCPPSEGLTTEHTDTLTAHQEHPGGRSFFHPFSVREGNTFYMARRRQEQTYTQRRDRDMER